MRSWMVLGALLLGGCGATSSEPVSRGKQPLAAAQARPAPPEQPRGAPEPGFAEGAEEEEIDDDLELEPEPAEQQASAVRAHPLDGLSELELERRLRDDPESLGSISLGQPGGGRLLNPVQMPAEAGWVLVDPANAWGTRETIDFLKRAIGALRAEHPGAHPLTIGHISARRGGPLSPHVSHQAGRDVDISYFYSEESSARWYARAHAKNLDRARTWSLVRSLLAHADVELILIDHSIQKLLREHALAAGEAADWVESLFSGTPGRLRPIIRHARGHATHLHVRFYNPIAQESARRLHALLLREGKVQPPSQIVKHRARRGETLGMLARKYGTSVAEIRRANGLRSTLIVAGRDYRIPKRTGIALPPRVAIPPRRIPPERVARDN
jgi:murein endopeptidase